MMSDTFTEAEIERYSRHIMLPEIGGLGQARLRRAKVLVIGAGGLGSPLLLYLAAGGVGTIGIVDDDSVDLSNLQRQIAHSTGRLGQAKTGSAAEAARAINPLVSVVEHRMRLTASEAEALVSGYDLICDGSDNFATRYLVADACFAARRTLISAAVSRFEGQITTFKPHLDESGPCYRCLYPEAPSGAVLSACEAEGVLGAVTGVMGSLQATEAIKEMLGLGEGLSGRLLLWDALGCRFRLIRVPRDLECPSCGYRAKSDEREDFGTS
jgi:molybdopterin/thiamine biosynthesis adenylyltransferase